MKKTNDLIATCLVRKDDFFKVNGYGLKVKYVNEDWNFWLKLISIGCYPVHMSFYGMWYRRKNTGELLKSQENKKEALDIIKKTANTIKNEVKGIQYPKTEYDNEDVIETVSTIKSCKLMDKKTNILIFQKCLTNDEDNRYLLEFVNSINYNVYNVTIILTEPNVNTLRQEFEQKTTVYDLTTFLNQEYWLSFINYIIDKENIDVVLNINSGFGLKILPYLNEKYNNIKVSNYDDAKTLSERNEEALSKENYTYRAKNVNNTLKSYFNENKKSYENLILNYIKNTYGNIHSAKIELLKEKLWTIPLWRGFVKMIKHK